MRVPTYQDPKSQLKHKVGYMKLTMVQNLPLLPPEEFPLSIALKILPSAKPSSIYLLVLGELLAFSPTFSDKSSID